MFSDVDIKDNCKPIVQKATSYVFAVQKKKKTDLFKTKEMKNNRDNFSACRRKLIQLSCPVMKSLYSLHQGSSQALAFKGAIILFGILIFGFLTKTSISIRIVR